MMRYTTLAALLLALCALPLWAQKYERKEMKTFDVSETPSVRISSEFGPIKVKSHGEGTVEVKVRILCEGETTQEAKEMAGAVRVRFSGTRESVDVELDMPGDWSGDDEDRSVRTAVYVIVPVKTSLAVKNRFGAVEVAGVTGAVSVDGQYGAVDVRQSSNVRVDNGFGAVTLTGIAGSVNARTKMGQLIANDVTGGSFTNQYGATEITNARGQIVVDTKMGNVTVRGMRGGRIKNSYGNIDVTLGPEFSGEVRAVTSFGSIDSSLPMKTKDDGPTAEKAIIKAGGGLDKLALECSFGGIDVNR